ncbi:MAG: electron transfer flavoprotein subunit alpha/FixB family protein [Francisellaceae bacterium]
MQALVVLDYENDKIISASLSALTAAKQLKCPIDALIMGGLSEAVIKAAQKLPHIDTVYVADHTSLADLLPENAALVIAKLAENYDYIISAHTTHGRNIMPRVAALLDVPQVSDVIEIIDANTYVRPIYAGNAYVTVRNTAFRQVVTIRAASFDPVEIGDDQALLSIVEVQEQKPLTICQGWEVHSSELPDLATASRVISGGRGLGSKDQFQVLESIAQRLNAAVGASRAAVDAGFVTNDYQVGQTGKIISPDLYIAVGISGAIQHLAGMKDSKCIVAINKDPDAPIFHHCDYGMVADLFEVLPQLDIALQQRHVSKDSVI